MNPDQLQKLDKIPREIGRSLWELVQVIRRLADDQTSLAARLAALEARESFDRPTPADQLNGNGGATDDD